MTIRESVSLPNFPKYAFHRTSSSNIQGILSRGFIPGGGRMYGAGWYFCYDLKDQFSGYMSNYGDSLVMAETNPEGVLIFDYNLARDVYGSAVNSDGQKAYTLCAQAVRWGIWSDLLDIPDQFYKISNALESSFQDKFLSAALAYNSFVCGADPQDILDGNKSYGGGSSREFFNDNMEILNKKIRGIMYWGNNDSRVYLSYVPDGLKIVSWISIEDEDKIKPNYSLPDGGLDWQSLGVKEKSLNDERNKNSDVAQEIFNGRVKSLSLNGMSKEEFLSKFDWLVRAKETISGNVIIDIDKDKKLHWKDGNWEGVWKDGFFEGGEFNQGKFMNGVFMSGEWNYGNFLGGQFGELSNPFKAPVWNDGLWTSGIWENNSNAEWNSGDIFDSKTGDYVHSDMNPAIFKANLVTEEHFELSDLSDSDQKDLYEVFKASYLKSVGTAWDEDHFRSRAFGWDFYGDKTGGIALRKQRSGLWKLDAVYGGKQIIKAYSEMMANIGDEPIWGVVTDDIGKMLEKHSHGEFHMAPGLVLKTLYPFIKGIFGDKSTGVAMDGGIEFVIEGQKMKKYLVGNKPYFSFLVNNSSNSNLPSPIVNLLSKILKAKGLI